MQGLGGVGRARWFGLCSIRARFVVGVGGVARAVGKFCEPAFAVGDCAVVVGVRDCFRRGGVGG